MCTRTHRLPVNYQAKYYLFNKSLFKYLPTPARKGLADFQARLFQSLPPFAQGLPEGAPQDRKGRTHCVLCDSSEALFGFIRSKESIQVRSSTAAMLERLVPRLWPDGGPSSTPPGTTNLMGASTLRQARPSFQASGESPGRRPSTKVPPSTELSVCWKRQQDSASLSRLPREPGGAWEDVSPAFIRREAEPNLSQERPSLFTYSQEILKVMKKRAQHPL